MTEPVKRPTGAAIAAAISPFVGLPLTFLFMLLVLGPGGDEYGGGPFSAVSRAWVEGGAGMYVVLLAGGSLAVISAALMFFGVHRGSPVILVNAPLASVLVAVGAFGYWSSMRSAIEAIAGAAPDDRATILAAATGEALNTTLFGLCAMGGLLVALLPGLLLGLIAQTGQAQRLLGVALGVFASLALVAWPFAKRLAELMGSFKAIAHVSPVDRLTILVGVGQELERYRVFVFGALGLLLVMVALGAVALKREPRMAILVPLMGLGGLFGLGAQAMAERGAMSAATTLQLELKPLGLVELEGAGTFSPRWCLSGDEVVGCSLGGLEGAVEPGALEAELASADSGFGSRDRSAVADDEPSVSVGVVRGATAAAGWTFLTAAARAGVRRVALVGEGPPRPLELPAEIALVARALDVRVRMVPLHLATQSAGCGDGCARATIEGDALVVGAERWTAKPLDGLHRRLTERVAISATPTLAPETLVKLAAAAAAHDRRLVVLVPDAEATPTAQPTEAPAEPPRPGETDREKVKRLMEGMFAPSRKP
jgi:hypothetical protein